jgi:hypothetical protein
MPSLLRAFSMPGPFLSDPLDSTQLKKVGIKAGGIKNSIVKLLAPGLG